MHLCDLCRGQPQCLVQAIVDMLNAKYSANQTGDGVVKLSRIMLGMAISFNWKAGITG